MSFLLTRVFTFNFLREGDIVYHTQSPDENALLSAARNFGFVFKEKTFDTITVLENGKLKLAGLEYNIATSIVRMHNNLITEVIFRFIK